MSIAANGRALAIATKQLMVQWRQTREFWRDNQSREFEQQYLADLQAGVDKAGPVFEELEKVIAKIRRDCE